MVNFPPLRSITNYDAKGEGTETCRQNERVRVKCDESGGNNANGVGSYTADRWGEKRVHSFPDPT